MNNSTSINNLTDDGLQDLYRSGNEAALVVLQNRYKEDLFKYAVGVLGNQLEAEEVVFQTLLKLGKQVHSNKLRSVSAWLMFVGARDCISKLRKLRGSASSTAYPHLLENITTVDYSPLESEKAVARYEKYFHESLESFATDKKRVLIGRVLKNESNQELATRLNKTTTQVKNLFDAGIVTVRRRMQRKLKGNDL